jgi:hypothetical protein
MIDLSTLLKDADPLAREESLSPEDAQRLRREMLAALPDREITRPLWRLPLALAAAAGMVMTVITFAGHRGGSVGPVDDPSAAAAALTDGGSSGAPATRQLQFATPGGTRIIWIFDEKLRLQESLP